MRISTNYMYENSRRTMQMSVSNLLKTQEVMASQQRINHLSDDPVDAGRLLNTQGLIQNQEQFLGNLETGTTFSNLYDGAFDDMISVLKRTKSLLVGAANSATSTAETREASRVEIVSLASQLTVIGNLQYSDRFLFAGYADDTAPFVDIQVNAAAGAGNTGTGAVTSQAVSDTALVTGNAYRITFTGANTYDVVNTTTGIPVSSNNAYTPGGNIVFDGLMLQISNAPAAGDTFDISTVPAGTYVGDSGVVQLEMERDIFQQVNYTGDRAFLGTGVPNGVNLFEIFEQANVALRNNDQATIQTLLTSFDQAIEQTSGMQAEVGARANKFDKATDRLEDIKVELDTILTKVRDVDVTEAVTNLNKQENAYQAVLAATAKVIQPSLLDFLS
jgi:flagellar hook-associated protein 3 FlgL